MSGPRPPRFEQVSQEKHPILQVHANMKGKKMPWRLASIATVIGRPRTDLLSCGNRQGTKLGMISQTFSASLKIPRGGEVARIHFNSHTYLRGVPSLFWTTTWVHSAVTLSYMLAYMSASRRRPEP